MVEHQLPKLAFAGSIPVSRSTKRVILTDRALLYMDFCAIGSSVGKFFGKSQTGLFFRFQIW